MIYFDHNASSPLLPEARNAWVAATEAFIGNPSSPHRLGGRADAALATGRESLARMLGCNPLDLVFTSGATEANNAVLHHLARKYPEGELWISAIEHPSVVAAAEELFAGRLRLIPVTSQGVADLSWIESQRARCRPAAIGLIAANNETGVLQPWREALQIARRWGVPLFCDATQWIGKLDPEGLGECDFLAASAHKFGGPRGAGFFKCPAAGSFHPLLRGGPQEEGRRAGTEDVAGVLAMVAALEHRHLQIKAQKHLSRAAWRDRFESLLARFLPGTEIVGAGAPRLWNTSSVLMPRSDCRHRWVVKLDKLGFAVSTGSACSSGKEQPSHVLTGMGISSEAAGRALRFSAGWQTTEREWEALLQAVRKVQETLSRVEA